MSKVRCLVDLKDLTLLIEHPKFIYTYFAVDKEKLNQKIELAKKVGEIIYE